GSGDATCELSPEAFAWLCAGVDWRRLSDRAMPRHVV
ncbi:MAG: IS66 family insertion sequence hypothetical protein, partial [Rhodanobacter sp.]